MAIKLKNSQFELLAEGYLTRFQSGGLVSQDVVKFRKNALQHPFIKDTPGYAERVKQLMESDLTLKVGAVKQLRAGSQYSVGPSNLGFLVDVVQESAPGLFGNAITVPIEVLEQVDLGNNRAPVPESLRRKERINIKPVPAPVKKRDKDGKATDKKDPERNLKEAFSQHGVGGSRKQSIASVAMSLIDLDTLGEYDGINYEIESGGDNLIDLYDEVAQAVLGREFLGLPERTSARIADETISAIKSKLRIRYPRARLEWA